MAEINQDEVSKLRKQVAELLLKQDGWQNLAAGLGRYGKDKTRATTFVSGCLLADTTLSSIYESEGFGAAIVDIVADDMTREWITIENDEENKITNELKRIHAESIFNQALKWARLYRGSGIVLGVSGNGEIEKPLTLGKGKRIMWMEVISAPQIIINNSLINEDLTSDNYGKIELFDVLIGINQRPAKIHYTKFLEFKGKPLPYDAGVTDRDRLYWGMSALQQPYEYLQFFGSANQAVANILLEFIVGKYALAGLRDMMANGQEERVIKRMEVINYIKSVFNAVLLDETESYTRDSATLAGFADILDRFQMNLSGVSRIPVTKLFRRSPAGMDATGESDITQYYDDIASEQENILHDPLQRIVNIVAVSLGMASSVDTADFPITFNPLYQMSEKERAEIDKLNADTDDIYMGGGVIDPAEVRVKRFPELDAKKMEEVPEEDE